MFDMGVPHLKNGGKGRKRTTLNSPRNSKVSSNAGARISEAEQGENSAIAKNFRPGGGAEVLEADYGGGRDNGIV